MMKRSVVVGTISAFSATACFADPPRYPVEQYCREVADVSGGSAMIFNTCIDMEQAAYDNLKRNWNAISSQTRSYCDEVAQVTGGSYSILETCIQMEEDARSDGNTFSY